MRITSISLISYVLLSFLSACGGGKKAPIAATPPAPPLAPECVDLDLAKVLATQEVTKCDGTKVMGLIAVCKEDSTVGCLTTETYKSADLTNLQAGNILSGMTIAGVSGSVTPAPADCLSDGETGCVAVTNFPAVDKVNNITANASKIRSSVTIAGVVGSLADCSADGDVGCVAVTNFPAVDKVNNITANASKIRSSVTIAGVVGSLADCSADGDVGCVAIGPTYAAAVTVGAASKILSGQSVAGIAGNVTLPQAGKVYKGIAYGILGNGSTGSLTLPIVVHVLAGSAPYGDPGSPLTPAMENRGSWALTAAFPGAGYYTGVSAAPSAGSMLTGTTVNAVAGTIDLTNLTEGNIKNGVTVAGVAGLYPNGTYTLPSAASGTADLENANFDAQVKAATAFEYWNSAGTRQTGAGDADITAGNIANGVSIFGLSGTSTGAAPDAWDVRVGTVINGVTGKLKVNCRNRVSSEVYNYDGPVGSLINTGITSGTAIDYWDTIDDYNNNVPGLPTNVVSGWTNNDCGGVEAQTDDVNVWKDVTTAGSGAATCAGSPERCTMQDKITALHWSKMANFSFTNSVTTSGSALLGVSSTTGLVANMVVAGTGIPLGTYILSVNTPTTLTMSANATATASNVTVTVNTSRWNGAVAYCDGLSYNGATDWRIPTQKELMESYAHGVKSAASANWTPEANMLNFYLWSGSGSSVSYYTAYAWAVLLAGGNSSYHTKTSSHQVVCVR